MVIKLPCSCYLAKTKNRNLDKFCPIFQGEGVKLGLIYCPNINILVLAMFKMVADAFTATIQSYLDDLKPMRLHF